MLNENHIDQYLLPNLAVLIWKDPHNTAFHRGNTMSMVHRTLAAPSHRYFCAKFTEGPKSPPFLDYLVEMLLL